MSGRRSRLESKAQRARIRELAERLDAHRKRQQAAHPKLTLTDMYNVLEKLRQQNGPHSPLCGQGADDTSPEPHRGLCGPLSAKERTIHEQGLVSVLRQLHDDLDAAVADAYGWPCPLTDEAILTRLCALNSTRAAEEARSHIRWLRPEFQRMKDEGGRMKEKQSALSLPKDAPFHPSSLILPRSAPGPRRWPSRPPPCVPRSPPSAPPRMPRHLPGPSKPPRPTAWRKFSKRWRASARRGWWRMTGMWPCEGVKQPPCW